MNETKNIETLMEKLGLGQEIGYKKLGFWTPQEFEKKLDENQLNKHGLKEQVIYALNAMVPLIEPRGRAHELVHCIDIAFGSQELYKQILQHEQKNPIFGLSEKHYDPKHAVAIFMTGLLHDIVLGIPQQNLQNEVSGTINNFVQIPNQVNQTVFYNKGPIEDEAFGAVIAHQLIKDLYSQEVVVSSFLKEQGLTSKRNVENVIPGFNVEKVIDAIWYHDGNFPTRGHAELAM
jgi:hypothetical protein